jgi:glycosyltransferase involved in cell wall biosynthesis
MPKYSFITAIDTLEYNQLEKCLKSIATQSGINWEWILAANASLLPSLSKLLRRFKIDLHNVHLIAAKVDDSISERKNAAIKQAIGDFLIFVDDGSCLKPNALLILDEFIDSKNDVDCYYTDEAVRNLDLSGVKEVKKPEFAKELLLHHDYIGRSVVIRRASIISVGLFNKNSEPLETYELYLKLLASHSVFKHIPEMVFESSTSTMELPTTVSHCEMHTSLLSGFLHSYSSTANKNYPRINSAGHVEIRRRNSESPLVSIVIPTRGTRKIIFGQEVCLVSQALRSVIEKSEYRNFEVIVVHDRVEKIDDDLLPFLNHENVRLVWYEKPFNFSDKCTVGALRSEGEYLIFLNDDTLVISNDWIETLLGYFNESDVGVTGPMLRLEDGRIQSAGHINCFGPQNFASGLMPTDSKIKLFSSFGREVSGVTAACMMVPKKLYFDLGGFSTVFPNSFNDVDFCFKALRARRRIIWTPQAELFHFESLSRNPKVSEGDLKMLQARWGRFIDTDRLTTGFSTQGL